MSKTDISNVAIQAEELGKSKWTEIQRPKGWRGRVYGLVVHTTGGSLPSRALKNGEKPHDVAIDYYLASHGTHYVCGWEGVEGGQLVQVASENQQANGASVTAQIESGADWEDDLPASMVARWKARWEWEGVDGPSDLYPTKYANSCYVHVEMPPCVFNHGSKLYTAAEPMAKGLRFTKAQHDGIVALSVDMAQRNGWPDFWWESGRFVGHEDISPVTRHVKLGGWDPGALRASPWFDWDYVVAGVIEASSDDTELGEVEEFPETPWVPSPVKKETLAMLVAYFMLFFSKLFPSLDSSEEEKEGEDNA